jgi:hypothetical protein
MRRLLKVVLWLVFIGGVVFVALQFVPYGRDHTNPPVTAPVEWDSARTEELVRGSCYDCHSNETDWPWYSNVAPGSWLQQRDVENGRERLNFSEWEFTPEQAVAILPTLEFVVESGEMPPWRYFLTHPGARLSDDEKEELLDGMRRTFGQ